MDGRKSWTDLELVRNMDQVKVLERASQRKEL
jgi:hypothetical protein